MSASLPPVPVACSLDAGALRDRERAWVDLLTGGEVVRRAVPRGIRLVASESAAPMLRELIDLERECCAWIHFEVDERSATLTAEGEGAAVLAEMFRSD